MKYLLLIAIVASCEMHTGQNSRTVEVSVPCRGKLKFSHYEGRNEGRVTPTGYKRGIYVCHIRNKL